MRPNNENTYLLLDGMPFIRDARGQNWVFSRVSKRWERHGTDDFDARHPTQDGWYAKNFEALPELPQ